MSNFYQDDGRETTGRKVCLATTSYDSPDASYTFSIQRSREALHKEGIETAYYLLQGNCHVDDARNKVVQEFLRSDCDELIFLDADVSWQPKDLIRLCGHDKDIVGGVYPFRREDKRNEMPVRMLAGAEVENGLLEVEGLPTGFMKIQRNVLERLAEVSPSHPDKEGGNVSLLFERTLENGTRWGGDLNFCNRWRAMGGRVYADYEMVLGHATKTVLKDSLGSALRRRSQTTLKHICEKVRSNTHTLQDLTEAREYVGNPYGALEEILAISISMAREAQGPIIETGSGLTTILMAAATDQTVFCLEHHGLYAAQLKQMAAEADVGPIGLCVCDLKDGWYDLEGKTLPETFALGLNDGPPRTVGTRKGFFTHLAPRTEAIICDDADDKGYYDFLAEWAGSHSREMSFIEPRAAILTKGEAWQQHATSLTAA